MIVFYLLILLPLLRQALPIKGEVLQKRKQGAMRLFFVILFLMLALRHLTVGRDLGGYSYMFDRISQFGWKEMFSYSIETAYTLLNKAVLLLHGNFRVLLVSVGLLTILPTARQYIKHSEDPILTISLFICMSTFFMLFSGLRQSISIALGFVAFAFTREKKLVPFVLIVILAVLFHTTAFMLAFMYPLYHARITKKWLLAVVPAMLALFVFNRQVFGFLTTVLSLFTNYIGSIGSTNAYTMLILFSLFSVYSFVIADEEKLDQDTIGMRNFLLFATALQMFAPLHATAMRMNYYYIIFIPLLIPKLIANRNVRWSQVALLSRYVMIVFFIAYFFINAQPQTTLDAVPYHFFWENVA